MFHASLPIIAAGHPPFHLLGGGKPGEPIDAGTLFFSVPASISRFAPAARIRAGPRSDEKRCTEVPAGLRASLPNIVFSKKERIDDEGPLSPLSSSILIISLYLLLHSAFGTKKLTTDPRFPDVCRQSSIFFALFPLIKVYLRLKNHFFSSGFPVSKTSSHLLSPHLALIYPAAAVKLTTEPRGRAFRRQFLLLSRKGYKLEVFPEYL